MRINPYRDLPPNFQPEFNFHRGPVWLTALAVLPMLERYAYPIAMKRGLCELWPISKGVSLPADFKDGDWIVRDRPKNDLERWIEGSLARLTQSGGNSSNQLSQKNRKFQFGKRRAIFFSLIPNISLTTYGSTLNRRRHVHKMNGTYDEYKRIIREENPEVSG